MLKGGLYIKIKKEIIVALMLFILVFGLATVSASEDADDGISATDDGGEAVSVVDDSQTLTSTDTQTASASENDNLSSVSDDSGEKLGAGTGTFTQLQSLINSNYGKTLTLTQDYAYDTAFGKTSGVEITDAITIDGQGKYTIDGKSASRIFQITGTNVILKNIKFTNGHYSSGGAIYWSGSSGTVENCYFSSNEATVTAQFDGGGAIYWSGINGKVTKSTFNENLGHAYGTAIYWTGTGGELSNSIISNNVLSATNSNAWKWGAVYWSGLNGKIINNNFTGNINKGPWGTYAGALGVETYNTLISNCIFKDNLITNIGETGSGNLRGGALRITGNNHTITDCKFINNQVIRKLGGGASEGNAWGAAVEASASNLTVRNCEFDNNSATGGTGNGYGGALCWYGSDGIMDNCTFRNNNVNSTKGKGLGSVYYTGSNGLITNTKFIDNEGNLGAGIYFGGDDLEISSCEFSGNAATEGSGVYVIDNKNIEITNSNFTNNNAETGTVYLGNNVYADLENNEFSGNTVESGSDITVIGTVNSEIIYLSPNGKGTGLTEDDSANWITGYKNVRAGGKIIFLAGSYSDVIKLHKFLFSKVIL